MIHISVCIALTIPIADLIGWVLLHANSGTWYDTVLLRISVTIVGANLGVLRRGQLCRLVLIAIAPIGQITEY